MSKPKMTHSAIIRGNDARTSEGEFRRVKLRETKLYWITEHRIKYRKPGGRGVGDWPMYDLDVDTIRPLGATVTKTVNI